MRAGWSVALVLGVEGEGIRIDTLLCAACARKMGGGKVEVKLEALGLSTVYLALWGGK